LLKPEIPDSKSSASTSIRTSPPACTVVLSSFMLFTVGGVISVDAKTSKVSLKTKTKNKVKANKTFIDRKNIRLFSFLI
jgi:hypothetical protein